MPQGQGQGKGQMLSNHPPFNHAIRLQSIQLGKLLCRDCPAAIRLITQAFHAVKLLARFTLADCANKLGEVVPRLARYLKNGLRFPAFDCARNVVLESGK